MDADELLRALVMATAKSDIPMAEKATLMQAACLLADSPTALEGWARVLTEHTAAAAEPRWPAPQIHPYFESDPSLDSCGYWLGPIPPAHCGRGADDATHRVEELTEEERAGLDAVLRNLPVVIPDQVRDRLWEMGMVSLDAVTTRGRAWLEAHPKGGEPR